MRKAILSVAPISGASGKFDPDETAKDLIECYKLGATQLHLHIRDPKGQLVPDTSYVRHCLEEVRKETDMLIELSTGGISQMTMAERCNSCYEPLCELTSLNVSTINLGNKPYINQIDDVRYNIKVAMEQGKHPEAEMFEIGHIYTMKDLDDEFHFARPIMLCLVTGYKGTMPANESALKHLVTACEEVFPNDKYVWGLVQAGRTDWDLMGKALDWGASVVRVGFEDSPWLNAEQKAEKNWELVRDAVKMMREHGVEPMTPAEARDLLHIPQLG